MRVGIVGAGGVGGYLGGRMALAGVDVALLARGEHLAAILRDGLRVRSVGDDVTVHVLATDDPSEIGGCDAVLFCVKSYDTEPGAALLEPLLGPQTAVVSLQNGIDNEDRIGARIGAQHVLGGAAFIFAHIAGPGMIEQTGGPCRIVFGEMDGTRSPRTDALLATCRAAGIDAAITSDIRGVLWDKYAFLCAVAGVTAATRLPMDQLLEVRESRELFGQLIAEVAAVARAEGVLLADDIVDQKTAFARGLERGSFSSLHHDLVTGRRLELDALHGELLRRAARHGLSLPASSVVYALLKPWEVLHQG